eukprot:sb/3466058/
MCVVVDSSGFTTFSLPNTPSRVDHHSTDSHQLINMKYFLISSAVLATAYGMEVAVRAEDGSLQFIDFNDPVIQELIQKLIALKKELLCGGTVESIIAALNLPVDLSGVIGILKGILCLNRQVKQGALQRRGAENLNYADKNSEKMLKILVGIAIWDRSLEAKKGTAENARATVADVRTKVSPHKRDPAPYIQHHMELCLGSNVTLYYLHCVGVLVLLTHGLLNSTQITVHLNSNDPAGISKLCSSIENTTKPAAHIQVGLVDHHSTNSHQLNNMKYFLISSAVLAAAYGMEVAVRAEDGSLQFIDFNDPVIKELIEKLIALKKELLCGGTIESIIETLNLPVDLSGVIGILKGILCLV